MLVQAIGIFAVATVAGRRLGCTKRRDRDWTEYARTFLDASCGANLDVVRLLEDAALLHPELGELQDQILELSPSVVLSFTLTFSLLQKFTRYQTTLEVVLDPGQGSFAKFPSAGRIDFSNSMRSSLFRRLKRSARKACLVVQRLHPGAAALLAEEAGLMRVIKTPAWNRAARRTGAAIELGSHRRAAPPKREITEWQDSSRRCARLPRPQQDSRTWIPNFVLR